jgi:hypothetical protein
MWFLLQSTYNYFFTPKIVFKNEILFQELPSLGNPKSHQHDSKLNKNLKFKPTMFHEQSLSQMFYSSKTM